MKKISFFLILTVLISSCERSKYCDDINGHNAITIVNNSPKLITYTLISGDSIYHQNGEFSNMIIPPYSSEDYMKTKKTCWEEVLETNNTQYEYILIFDQDTVNAIGWQNISDTNRGLLKTFKIDVDYLISNEFRLVYEE